MKILYISFLVQGASGNEKYETETSADWKSWRILKGFEIKSSIRTTYCNHKLLLRFSESTDSKRSIIQIKHQLRWQDELG